MIKLPSFGLRSLCNAYCQCREWLGWWHQFLENLPEPRMRRPTFVFCSWVFWWHLRSPFRFREWDPDRRYGYSKIVLELPIVKCSFQISFIHKNFPKRLQLTSLTCLRTRIKTIPRSNRQSTNENEKLDGIHMPLLKLPQTVDWMLKDLNFLAKGRYFFSNFDFYIIVMAKSFCIVTSVLTHQ